MPMRSVSGFTLIELIVVIAILAILAATAIPKFIDLRNEAAIATAQGMAAALASGTSINFAARIAGNAAATAVTTCGNASLTLQGGVFPTAQGTFAFQNAGRTVGNGQFTICSITFQPTGSTIVGTASATV